MSCALYSVLAVCRDRIATESTRASTPQRDQSRPNRANRTTESTRASTPQRDRIATESTRQSRPNRRANRDRIDRIGRPNRRAQARRSATNRDRIDAPIAIESTRQSRSNREIATESTRQSRPIDAPITTNRRANRDRIEKSRPNRPNRTTPLHPFLSGERNSILVLSIFSPYTALFYKSLVKKEGGGWVVRSSFSQFFFALVEGGGWVECHKKVIKNCYNVIKKS